MLRATFAIPFAFATVGLAGCFVTVKEDDDGFGGFGGDDVTVSTSKGVTVTTDTTATTTTVATTDTSSSTGAGCVGPDGTGLELGECDAVGNISECPSTAQPPVANSSCKRGYQIFSAGSWENFLGCLKAIPTSIADLCDEPAATDHVQACTSAMYDAACPNAFADTTCSDVATVVCGAEGGFDEASCKAQLVPFSDAGINAYRTCIDESTTVPCSALHETCLTQVISF